MLKIEFVKFHFRIGCAAGFNDQRTKLQTAKAKAETCNQPAEQISNQGTVDDVIDGR